MDTRVIAGVAAGLGHYFGIDRTIIRIIFIASVFLGGFGIVAYLILWMATPLAKTSAQKLEMRGEAVTLKAMSEIVRERFEELDRDDIKNGAKGISREVEQGARSFFSWIGPVIKAVVGVFVTLGALCATAGLTVLTTLALFRLPERFFGPTAAQTLHGAQYSIAVVAVYLSIVLPIIIVLLWGISLLRKKSLLNRINVLVFGSLWFLALVVAGVTVSRLAYKVSEQMKNDPMVAIQTTSQVLTPFTALNVQDEKNVTIVIGEEYKIEYTGTQYSVQNTVATVQDGILSISGKDNVVAHCMFCDNRPLHITITMPLISAITTTDVSRVYGDIDAQTLTIVQSDASRVTLTGTAVALDLNIKDASRFEGSDLVLKSARVVSRDASRTTLDVESILVVESYDASRVEYTGAPQAKIDAKEASRVEPVGETIEE